MIGGVLAALGAGAVNNIMSEWHADRAFSRQKELMHRQQAMNNANAVNAYSQQVEGARLAGLNPAMLNGQQPAVQNVSQASAPKAENVELDPATLLLSAQKENLDADTDKKRAEADKARGVDTENVVADTALKTAQAVYSGASTDKVKAETTRIENDNKVFADENELLQDIGRVMAEKWRGTPWYEHLSPDSKKTVDALADGSIPVTVGGLRAIRGSIDAQKSLSDADRALVDNAFANAVTESMYRTKEVMDALKMMPKYDLDKLKAETSKAIAETGLVNVNRKWSKDQYDAYRVNNGDYTYSQYMKNPTGENFVRWLVSTSNDKLNKLYDFAGRAAGNYIGGRAFGSGVSESRTDSRHYDSRRVPPIFGGDGSVVKPGYTDQGVQQMRFK